MPCVVLTRPIGSSWVTKAVGMRGDLLNMLNMNSSLNYISILFKLVSRAVLDDAYHSAIDGW